MCMYVLLSGVPQPSGYLMGDLHDALSDFGNFFIRNLNGEVSIFHGCTLDFSVPFLVTFFCTL